MAKKIIAVLLVLAMVFSLAACGTPANNNTNGGGNQNNSNEAPKTDKYGGVYRVITTAKCTGLFPLTANLSNTFTDPCYESLIWIDNLDNSITKVLCTDYTPSADGKEVTVKIRQGVKFHDGSDLNADVVVWNYELANKNRILSKSHNPTCEKVDDYTVKIIFDKMYLDYENALTLKIASKKHYDDVGEEKYMYDPCGTGPFKFKENGYVADTSVAFVKWEGYWGKSADGDQLPYLDGYEILSINDDNAMMTALVNGDGDCMKMGTKSVIDQLKASGYTDKRILGADAFILYGIAAFDGHDASIPWSNIKVREAVFKYGIDYEKVMKLGEPDLGILDHNLGAEAALVYDKSINSEYTYDAAKCKELLKEAGYENGFDSTIYCISIATDIATAIQSNLKDVGINLKVETVGSADQRRKDGSTPGLFMLTLPSYYDNVSNTMASTFDPDGTGYCKNMIFLDNYKAKKLAAQGAQTNEERAKLGVEALKALLLEDYTATVVCHVFTPVFESMDVHDSHCGNFQMTPATIWREVKNK